ncbi:HhH-GDP family DNA glycosylase [Streptomyces triticirhizae]|uniref:Endonuclease n=1 Tax=Streptomyces triticirhizae TaxID=2483353 RepID=A0A3M2LFP1_9ACTN|nr:endonuclease [Streptomyces triticirhizae]RMI35906.1 endonuclease [Streptomyces triticirhizae]
MTAQTRRTARALLDRCGETYAAQAGIRLRDTPAPLYQTLVLAHLLSARIKADVAVAAARALFDAGMRTPRAMADATWQRRVDALGVGHYRRYDERTATQLGDGARLLLDRYGGDVRRMREEAPTRLREYPGIGPMGVDIFLREVQAVWPEYAPYVDSRAKEGARRVGLPRSARGLSELVRRADIPRLTAGLVRVSLDKRLARDVTDLARA